MKKIILTSVAAIFATTAAQALTISPQLYISNKVSYSFIQQTDGTMTDPLIRGIEYMTDADAGTFGNKLAVGVAFPIEASGTIRGELEWGIWAKAKLKNDAKKSVGYNGDGSINWITTDPEDLSKGTTETSISTYFFNAYYDIDTGTWLSLYVGGGAGFATIDTDAKFRLFWGYDYNADPDFYTINKGGSASNFGWNVAAGFIFTLTDNIAIDLGYRYVNLGEITTTTQYGEVGFIPAGEAYNKASLAMHDVSLGLRYTF